MAIDLDLTNDDPTKTGFDPVAPGKAHAQMVKWTDYGSKNGDHVGEFEVVAHQDPDQVGKVHTEYFSQKSTVVWKLRTLAIALGLTTVDALSRAKEAGQSVPLEFADGVNRQLFVTFSNHEYNGKTSTRIEGGMFHLTDPKAKGHPRNVGMLKRSGVPLDSIPAPAAAADKKAATPAKPAAPQKPAAPAAPAAVEDAFGF